MTKKYVKCRKCQKTDKPDNTVIPHNIGTSEKMRCPDCTDCEKGFALECRSCCPTGHRTNFRPGQTWNGIVIE